MVLWAEQTALEGRGAGAQCFRPSSPPVQPLGRRAAPREGGWRSSQPAPRGRSFTAVCARGFIGRCPRPR
eukprot:10269457-Lingulodinium_polyedra.AAC.1